MISKKAHLFFIRLTASVLTVLCVCCLASCGKEKLSTDDIAYRLLTLFPNVPPCTQYVKNAEKYTPGYISREDFSYIYTGLKQNIREWDKIEDFRIILSNTVNSFEIHVIKAMNSSDTDEICKLLERRSKLLNSHILSESDFPVNRPQIVVNGKYVFLLATSDNNSAASLIEKML